MRGSSIDHRELVRQCDRVTVTRLIVLEGAGIGDSPAREVRYWYDDDGTLIARRDAWEDSARSATEGPQDG